MRLFMLQSLKKQEQKLGNWLQGAPTAWFVLYALVAGFSTYFCMYAFRKPFAAAAYEGVSGWDYLIDFKILAITAQVLGYALSKFIGIKIVSEISRGRRALVIVGLIVASELALILFATLPPELKIIAIFLNGLPLGMIWGLVFSFMEGRLVSEILGAGLCASFIVSSGAVKSVGAALIKYMGVAEFWMPAATGALFLPLLMLSVYFLSLLPPPQEKDEKHRSRREPMDAAERALFFRSYAFGFICLALSYVVFTALRDFRDNFAAELWIALGYGDVPSVFLLSELPIAVIVLIMLGVTAVIRNNTRALLLYHRVVIAGAATVGLSTLLYSAGFIGPFAWMVLLGTGLYVAYVPFNCIIFDRLLAAVRDKGNAGFMIYVVDAFGYLGSFLLLLYKNFGAAELSWLDFFQYAAYTAAVLGSGLVAMALLYFRRRLW